MGNEKPLTSPQLVERLQRMLISLLAVFIVRGFVIMMMWQWFIVPTFNVPTISVATACGLSIALFAFVGQWNRQSQKSTLAQDMVQLVSINLFVLIVGWMLHFWV